MTKENKKINFLATRLGIVVLAILLIVLGARTLSALSSTVQVTLSPTIADVCPNIDGVQTSIPVGMLLDSGGNCYTPAPDPIPPNPTPVDLCSNLTGIQSILPDGYYRTDAGQCYLQLPPPATPIDVCQNLDGDQGSVPANHYLDTSNNCMPSPTTIDLCLNIPGIQSTIPDGMETRNNQCFTPPSTVGSNPDEYNSGSLGSVEQLKNVPQPLQPIAKAIVEVIPEETVRYFRSLPEESVKKIPEYVLVLVVIMTVVPLLQSIREATYAKQIAFILRRERSVAEQKDNFIALASHYLRTPLTVMRNGLDMMITTKEIQAETTTKLSETLDSLDKDIATVLLNLEENRDLKDISLPTDAEKAPSVLGSVYFWMPTAVSITLTIVANFLLGVVGDKQIAIDNTLFQLATLAVFVLAVYLLVRNIFIQKHLKAQNQRLIEHEKTIDESRNDLIAQQTEILKTRLDEISREQTPIERAPSFHMFEDGYLRFARMLEKFLLLGQIQAGAQRTVGKFNIRDAIEQVLFSYQSDIAAKDLRIVNAVENSIISQNEMLFNFVISSLIDNAIKFNKEGGTITISSNPSGKKLFVNVSDNGIGIDNSKLDQLFKPFSRAGSAIEFNYEGLGFSLFLNKLIMDYTGGSIAALSEPSGGTKMTIGTPVSVSL